MECYLYVIYNIIVNIFRKTKGIGEFKDEILFFNTA